MNPSTREEQLWRELGELFADDDGSFPEIRLLEVSADGAANIFDELRSRAEPLEANQTVWLDEREQELPLTDVSDAGALAATSRISTLSTSSCAASVRVVGAFLTSASASGPARSRLTTDGRRVERRCPSSLRRTPRRASEADPAHDSQRRGELDLMPEPVTAALPAGDRPLLRIDH
jgi:hypothetical protein